MGTSDVSKVVKISRGLQRMQFENYQNISSDYKNFEQVLTIFYLLCVQHNYSIAVFP